MRHFVWFCFPLLNRAIWKDIQYFMRYMLISRRNRPRSAFIFTFFNITKKDFPLFLKFFNTSASVLTCQIALSQKFHAVVTTLYSGIFSSTCCNSVGFPKSPVESNNGSPKTAASQNAEAVSEELISAACISDFCIISLKSNGLLCFPG